MKLDRNITLDVAAELSPQDGEEYLGDCCYASDQRGMIRLRAFSGATNGFVEIFLRPEVFRALLEFANRRSPGTARLQ